MKMKKNSRALCFLLAALLCFSLMTFAGAAETVAFPDVSADNPYAQAISFIKSLGVVGGDDKGNFNPEATIKRSEFCKIVYVLYNGTSDAASHTKKSAFPDVADNAWYNGYVNWASASGIVGGRDTGLFDPDAPVTVAEAAKMFIVAVTGKNNLAWPGGFIDEALRFGILDRAQYDNVNSPAARQLVAQFAYNAVYTTSVLIEKSTPAQKFFNITLYTEEKLLLGCWSSTTASMGSTNLSNAVILITEPGSVYLADLWKDTRADTVNSGKVYSSGTDPVYLVGTAVRVTYTDSNMNAVLKLEPLGSSNTYRTSQLSYSDGKYYADGQEIKVSLELFGSGRCLYIGTSTPGKYLEWNSAKEDIIFENLSDDLATLTDVDGDGEIDYIYFRYVTGAAQITAIDAEGGKVSIDGTFGSSVWFGEGTYSVVTTEGFSVGDYVNISYLWNSEKVRVFTLTKAELVTGKISAVSDGSVTIDGKAYPIVGVDATMANTAANGLAQAEKDALALAPLSQDNVGKTVTIILDMAGYVQKAILSE